METGQSNNSHEHSDNWINPDHFPETTMTLPASFTSANSRDVENSRQYSTYSPSALTKRQAEPTQHWPKRHKHGQAPVDRYPPTPTSSHQPFDTVKSTELASFPSPELCSQAEPGALPAENGSYGNTFYHPTPPSTEPAHLPYSVEGPVSDSKVDGDQLDHGGLSSLPFPDLNQWRYSESHQDKENVAQGNQDCADLQPHYTPIEPAGYSPLDESLVDDTGLNHISAMRRFLSYKSSKLAVRQAPPIQANLSDNEANFIDKEEEHFEGESLDEEMAQLAEARPISAHHTPPSSVVRDMFAGSDTEVFDPRLQRSPPGDSKGPGDREQVRNPETFEDESLLSSDVDWDGIMQSVSSLPYQGSLSQQTSKATPVVGKDSPVRGLQTKSSNNGVASSQIRSTSSKQMIPPSSANSPPITIPKTRFRMRTFFRVAELINEGKMFFDVNQQPTFEFYAWVGESWREEHSKVQHFVFIDLYKEDRLEIRGTLSGWITNGELDKQSYLFLSVNRTTSHELCRCVCKVVQDQKHSMSLVVLWIQPATWVDISKKKLSLS
ncbi:hypothetical protein V8F20_003401 [Naviculisporaceae sp. PSN 640]